IQFVEASGGPVVYEVVVMGRSRIARLPAGIYPVTFGFPFQGYHHAPRRPVSGLERVDAISASPRGYVGAAECRYAGQVADPHRTVSGPGESGFGGCRFRRPVGFRGGWLAHGFGGLPERARRQKRQGFPGRGGNVVEPVRFGAFSHELQGAILVGPLIARRISPEFVGPNRFVKEAPP